MSGYESATRRRINSSHSGKTVPIDQSIAGESLMLEDHIHPPVDSHEIPARVRKKLRCIYRRLCLPVSSLLTTVSTQRGYETVHLELPINEFYVNPELIITKRNESKKTENISDVFQDHFPGKRILLHGKLGYGKSATCHKIASDWANDEGYITKNFDTVLLIPLGCTSRTETMLPYDPRLTELPRLEDLIASLIHINGYTRDEVHHSIFEINPTRVCIIFDGYTECQQHKYMNFLSQVLDSQLYPESTIIFTSRDDHFDLKSSSTGMAKYPLANLWWDARITINGISPTQQNVLINNALGALPIESVQAFMANFWHFNHPEYDSSNSDDLFSCPLFLLLLLILWGVSERTQDVTVFPRTQSQLFSTILKFIIRTQFQEKMNNDKVTENSHLAVDLFTSNGPPPGKWEHFLKSFCKFGEFCFNNLLGKRDFTIELELFSDKCGKEILQEMVGMGVLSKTKRVCGYNITECVELVHKSFANFFTAVYLWQLLKDEGKNGEFEEKVKSLKPGMTLTVMPIVAGILGSMVGKIFGKFVPNVVLKRDDDYIDGLLEAFSPVAGETMETFLHFIPVSWNVGRDFVTNFDKLIFQYGIDTGKIRIVKWDGPLNTSCLTNLKVQHLFMDLNEFTNACIPPNLIQCEKLTIKIGCDLPEIDWKRIFHKISANTVSLHVTELNDDTAIFVRNMWFTNTDIFASNPDYEVKLLVPALNDVKVKDYLFNIINYHALKVFKLTLCSHVHQDILELVIKWATNSSLHAIKIKIQDDESGHLFNVNLGELAKRHWKLVVLRGHINLQFGDIRGKNIDILDFDVCGFKNVLTNVNKALMICNTLILGCNDLWYQRSLIEGLTEKVEFGVALLKLLVTRESNISTEIQYKEYFAMLADFNEFRKVQFRVDTLKLSLFEEVLPWAYGEMLASFVNIRKLVVNPVFMEETRHEDYDDLLNSIVYLRQLKMLHFTCSLWSSPEFFQRCVIALLRKKLTDGNRLDEVVLELTSTNASQGEPLENADSTNVDLDEEDEGRSSKEASTNEESSTAKESPTSKQTSIIKKNSTITDSPITKKRPSTRENTDGSSTNKKSPITNESINTKESLTTKESQPFKKGENSETVKANPKSVNVASIFGFNGRVKGSMDSKNENATSSKSGSTEINQQDIDTEEDSENKLTVDIEMFELLSIALATGNLRKLTFQGTSEAIHEVLLKRYFNHCNHEINVKSRKYYMVSFML